VPRRQVELTHERIARFGRKGLERETRIWQALHAHAPAARDQAAVDRFDAGRRLHPDAVQIGLDRVEMLVDERRRFMPACCAQKWLRLAR
jgi:hypothetical protein